MRMLRWSDVGVLRRVVGARTVAALLSASAVVLIGAGATAPGAAASTTAIGGTPDGTSCTWYANKLGKGAVPLNGVQCVVTTSFGGNPLSKDEPGAIPLVTGAGLIGSLNTWLASKGIGAIDSSSNVGVEAIGGTGRNGKSCGTCSSGKGGGGGYAVTVQTLGGMQQLIATSYYGQTYVDPANGVPPALFVLVGRQGVSAQKTSLGGTGGGGGSASWVTGVQPNKLATADVMFPSAQTNGSLNDQVNPGGRHDDLVFAIAGGGGGGGGAQSSGTGGHGGTGGRMTATGPITSGDTTVDGTRGKGSNHGAGGGGSADTTYGLGGKGGGNAGTQGVGGQGGYGTSRAGFVGTSFTWAPGLGGPIGGTYFLGGAGGGGWGGGAGAGQSKGADGGGAGGGGSWARQAVTNSSDLPTLIHLYGTDFSLSKVGFSQVVLSFGVAQTGARITKASLTGVATNSPTLKLKVVDPPEAKLRSLKVVLPHGLRFAGRHPKFRRITFRHPVRSHVATFGPKLLHESRALHRRARHHRLTTLNVKVIIRTTAGRTVAATYPIRERFFQRAGARKSSR